MDKIIIENKQIIRTLTDQIKELHLLFTNIYGKDRDYMKHIFYRELCGSYTYLVYDKGEDKYRVLCLQIDIGSLKLGDSYCDDVHINGIITDDDPYDLEPSEFIQESIGELKGYMEFMLRRPVTSKDICTFVNTETLVATTMPLLYTDFFQTMYSQDEIISLLRDEELFLESEKRVYKEYRYNISMAASTIGNLLGRVLKTHGLKFNVIPLTSWSQDGSSCVMTKCYPIAPLYFPKIEP